MAWGVVDLLEVIRMHERHGALAAFSLRQGMIEPVKQQPTVRLNVAFALSAEVLHI